LKSRPDLARSGLLFKGYIGSCSERVWRLARRGTRHWVTATVYWWSPLPFRAGTFSLYPPLSPSGGPGGRFRDFQAPKPEPSAGLLAAGRRLALRVVYLHTLHQGRLPGAVSAAWALCRRTWSCWISWRRAASSVWRVATRSVRALSWPFGGWSFSSSTSQRYGAVGSLWAVSSPLLMRLRTVSLLTPRRCAASPIDTFSTVPPHNPNCNILGVCPCNRLVLPGRSAEGLVALW